MTYGTLDHVYVTLLALTAPLFAVWTYRRMIASLAAGDAGARTRSFRRAIGLGLVDVAVILVLFAVAGRPVEGLVRLDWLPQGWWTGAAWGVVLLACALLIAQVAAIRGNETGLSTARKQMTSVEGVLPHTPGELKLFLALSLAAGVGEEIVYRGYLLAYFDALVGPAGAVLASTLLFGLGHAYQGAGGIVKTGIVGLLLAGAYVATGNLLAAMLLHVVIDASSGMVAYLALRPVTAVGGQPARGFGLPGGDGPRRSGVYLVDTHAETHHASPQDPRRPADRCPSVFRAAARTGGPLVRRDTRRAARG